MQHKKTKQNAKIQNIQTANRPYIARSNPCEFYGFCFKRTMASHLINTHKDAGGFMQIMKSTIRRWTHVHSSNANLH